MVVVMKQTRYTLGCLGLVVLTAGSVSLRAQQGTQQRFRPASMLMSGTYDLETTRGASPQRAADEATRHLPPPQRDRAYQRLLIRLQPPTTLAIHRDGRTVTISSSSGPRATFDADGRTRQEPGPGGRMTVTRARFIGNQLSVSTSGNRSTDFLVIFAPLNNGDGLLVTRRMDSDELRQPVTIQSYYRRVADEPRWDLYEPETGYDERPGREPFTVPDGTQIVAELDTPLSTRTSRSGERFSMTVLRPPEYQDARIDGVVARITPYGQGRNAEMRIDFDTIERRDGQRADFDAVLETVRTPGGVTLRVDASGGVPDPRQTNAAIQQGAIGAALGAIIGAIAGGGKGAAIGAVVGGAGGAILAQDRDQYLDLPPGTRVTMIATSPRYRTP
jgi:hypothetical protein